MTILVRRILPGDTQTYRDVRLAALQDSPDAFGATWADESRLTTDDWVTRTETSAAGERRAVFFALDAEAAVGLVGGFRPAPDQPELVELYSMWVDPAHRGQGIATSLIDAVAAWARETRATTLELWVRRGNEPATNRYRSAGFDVLDGHQAAVSDPCHSEIRMRKAL